MTLARLRELARKAVTMPPRQSAARLADRLRAAGRRPWSHLFPVLLTDRALLRQAAASSVDELWSDLSRAPFFLHPADRAAYAAAFTARFPDERQRVIEAAERVLRHEFDLLGSGPRTLSASLPWHEDFKTGRTWPLEYGPRIEYNELDRPSDVKVPWELSRCQHFTVLAQAHWLTGDDRYASEVASQIRDWVVRNPYSRGINWACAMDVGLRAISWIWTFYFLAESKPFADRKLRAMFLRTLYMHGEYVLAHLEKGPINGNHYLADGVGLVFLGCFFKATPKGQSWLAAGRTIVAAEILTQVTSDGVDFEASTAYHRLVLELFATAYALLRRHGEQIGDAQWKRLEHMYEFVEAYTKPDGLSPLIGDADDGRVQILGRQPINDHRYLLSTGAVLFGRRDFKRAASRFWEESFWLLGPDGARRFDALADDSAAPASRAFAEGGYFVLRARRTHLIIDFADVGMRGLGGHGHNDILSFELVLDGVRVVTDCGAYLYTASREWRNRFRSTAYHASIEVDRHESNRFISPDNLWQLHDDARPVDVRWQFGPAVDSVSGGHTGYSRLADPVRPVRAVAMHKSGNVVAICDRVEGRTPHEVVWRFPLDPSVTAEIRNGDARLAVSGAERWFLPADMPSASTLSIEDGWVSPSYGVKTACQVLTLRGVLQLPCELQYLFSTSWLSHSERMTKVRELGFSSEAQHATSPS